MTLKAESPILRTSVQCSIVQYSILGHTPSHNIRIPEENEGRKEGNERTDGWIDRWIHPLRSPKRFEESTGRTLDFRQKEEPIILPIHTYETYDTGYRYAYIIIYPRTALHWHQSSLLRLPPWTLWAVVGIHIYHNIHR